MEVSALFKSFKLVIDTFGLLFVSFYWEVALVVLGNVLTEFLFYFYLSEAVLKVMKFVLKEEREIVLNLLV